jgi:hypothetical protein
MVSRDAEKPAALSFAMADSAAAAELNAPT